MLHSFMRFLCFEVNVNDLTRFTFLIKETRLQLSATFCDLPLEKISIKTLKLLIRLKNVTSFYSFKIATSFAAIYFSFYSIFA